MSVITRFAPSPTGMLHIGHAFSALFSFNKAMEQNGTFLLRIEDIDQNRCRPEFEKYIFEDLQWLGIDWEKPVRRQSEHMEDYKKALAHLKQLGVLYPCFCTRKEIREEIEKAGNAPHESYGYMYPNICKNRNIQEAEGKSFALRLDMEKAVKLAKKKCGTLEWNDAKRGIVQAAPEKFGDIVLARKDTPVSYHLAVTLDDNIQNVSLVTRGEDLFESTHIHRLLQALLDLKVPKYHHHRLLVDEKGQRFAKRNKSLTLHFLREKGYSNKDVLSMIGKIM